MKSRGAMKCWKTAIGLCVTSYGKKPPAIETGEDVTNLLADGEAQGMLFEYFPEEPEEMSAEKAATWLEPHGVAVADFIKRATAGPKYTPAAEADQNKTIINDAVKVLLVPEQEPVTPETKFWLHTAGMDRFGRAELEMRDVPVFSLREAGAGRNTWAAHSLSNPISAGERMNGAGPIDYTFTATPSRQVEFWDDTICLELIVSRVAARCEHCHTPHAKPDASCDEGSDS